VTQIAWDGGPTLRVSIMHVAASGRPHQELIKRRRDPIDPRALNRSGCCSEIIPFSRPDLSL